MIKISIIILYAEHYFVASKYLNKRPTNFLVGLVM